MREGQTIATFTPSEIISVSYAAYSPDNGFSGIATSSIDITLANKTAGVPACQKGDKITLSNGGDIPYFFVQDRDFDTYTTSLVAYDSCCKLDQEFDNSNFDELDSQGNIKLYTQAQVLEAVRYQTGLNISSPVSTGEMYAKDDLQGSCRIILEDMTAVNGFMWVCSTGNQITHVAYKSPLATATVSEFSEVLADTSQTAFNGLVVNDLTYNETYSYGSGNVFKYIDSNLIKGNSNVGGELYTRFQGIVYKSFSLKNAKLSTTFFGCIPQQVTYPTGENTTASALALNMSAVYTVDGWIIDYSSPECKPANNTYKSKDKRDLEKAVKKDQKMGIFFLNENGSGVRLKI